MHFISRCAYHPAPDGRQWFALTATARMRCLLSPPPLASQQYVNPDNRYSTRHGQGTVSRDGDPARPGCLSWRSILFYTLNAVGLPPACLMVGVKGDEGGASLPCEGCPHLPHHTKGVEEVYYLLPPPFSLSCYDPRSHSGRS